MSDPVQMTESAIYQGDSLNVLKTIKSESVDAVVSDPPYGFSFMGKDWDKAVPSVDIWRECLRVLKPGGWCMVMSAPRSDVQNAMISRLMEAGFRLDFTPIYWSYASGFPKAGNVTRLAMKKLGDAGEVTGTEKVDIGMQGGSMHAGRQTNVVERDIKKPTDPRIKALDGSYTGFQPKPAVEVVIVAMKPLSEKTYVDQALKNGKGITWLDDGRIPTEKRTPGFKNPGTQKDRDNPSTYQLNTRVESDSLGRFPANLLVQDQALNGHSKFFDLDAWADTLPFLAVPKASKSEKNAGLEHLKGTEGKKYNGKHRECSDCGNRSINSAGLTCGHKNYEWVEDANIPVKNHHPTVKPLKLMSYLITITTREGDTVLDPFVGSGTTAVAAKQLGRIGIGIEREMEYATIAAARVAHAKQVPPVIEQTSLLE